MLAVKKTAQWKNILMPSSRMVLVFVGDADVNVGDVRARLKAKRRPRMASKKYPITICLSYEQWSDFKGLVIILPRFLRCLRCHHPIMQRRYCFDTHLKVRV